MNKFNKLVTGFALGILMFLVVAASIDYRALNTNQFTSSGTVSIITGAVATNTYFYSSSPNKQALSTFDRWLIDTNGNLAADWSRGIMYEAGGALASLNYGGRRLTNSVGGEYLNWNTGNITSQVTSVVNGLSISNHIDVSASPFITGGFWGYDGTTGKWTNGTLQASSVTAGTFASARMGSITNHTDVSSAAFVTGNTWGYDGLTGVWTNGPKASVLRTNTILSVTIAGTVGTGVVGVYPVAGDAFTISGWSITAVGTAPTCTIDVWKIANGTALPTVANTIMGTKPALASGNVIESTTLTSWSTAVTKGDIWGVNVDAVSGATNLVFQIFGYR